VSNTLFLSASASFSASLADPIGSSPLVAAMLWLQNTLLGTIALSVAIIAVASVGLLTLTGRIHLRHGATVILGCFVLFGASSIVAGLQAAVAGGDAGSADIASIPPPPAVVVPPMPERNSDPYAGASVPSR
jgi:type IV secretory pathway VirB2 component (pilin)